MFAVYASSFSADAPLDSLTVGERPEPQVPDGWTTVQVRAAALNHHDVWSLRGVGLREDALPMILGCDAAGVDEDGNEVVVHAVVSDPAWSGDETLDPKRSLLSERHQGTFADRVAVPRRNLVPKPAGLSFEEAACLPTAWLTAYRMLFTQSGLRPGDTFLVQGAGGGVATALIKLGRAAGLRVYVTSRSEDKRSRALELGAHEAFESGARLPQRVDAVMETVGAATWSHSVKSLRPGGTIAAYHWDMAGGGFPLQPVLDAVRAEGHASQEPPSSWASALDASDELWRKAGLGDVQTRQFEVRREFDSFDEYWRSAHGSPRLKNLFASLEPAALQRVSDRVRDSVGATHDGPLGLHARANAVKGRRV